MTMLTEIDIPFDEWVLLPENVDKHYELINGEIVEKMVSGEKSTNIASIIMIQLGIYLLQNPIGRLSGEQGGYMVGTHRYIPDVGYISKARRPQRGNEPYVPLAPDLAVEVLWERDYKNPREMRLKVTNYLLAGTMVWLVSPRDEKIEVYVPHQPPHVLGLENTLEGGNVLPGFAVPVRAIFADE